MNFSTHQPNFRAGTWYPGMPYPDPGNTTDTRLTTEPIYLNCLRCWGQKSESLGSDWALFQLPRPAWAQGLQGDNTPEENHDFRNALSTALHCPHCPLLSSLLFHNHSLSVCSSSAGHPPCLTSSLQLCKTHNVIIVTPFTSESTEAPRS